MTPEEGSELLRKSPRTLKAWRRHEYGVSGPPWEEVGGTVLYWQSEVMAWLSDREAE